MYLLRNLTERERISQEVAELKILSAQALKEATEMAEAHERIQEEAKLKLADHGYADGNELSEATRIMRDELLQGRGSFYAYSYYGTKISSEDKHDVARAIMLTRGSWFPRSPLDPIAKKLTRMALLDYQGLSADWTAFDVDGRANVDIDTIFERSELFGKNDRKVINGASFEEHPVTIRTGRGPTNLNLLIGEKNESFQWVLRGKSKLSPPARKLLRELNSIAEDQRQRTSWAEDYQIQSPLPGLTAAQQKELLAEFGRWSESMPKSLPGARPGIHFEYEHANKSGTRVYPVRCDLCSRVSAYEIVYCVGELIFEKEFSNPESKHIRHREDVEHSVNTMLKKFHRDAHCYSVHGTSSRTGASICTDDIGWLVD